jgi:hypothetical protein
MTYNQIKRTLGAATAAVVLTLFTAGCDVTNPGPIQDEFLGDEAAQIGLVNGAIRSIVTGYAGAAYDMEMISRQIFPGGQIGAWGNAVPIHAGSIEPENGGPFTGMHQARFIAETAIQRFTAAGASDERMFLAHLWAGWSYRILGEWWCDTVLPSTDPSNTDAPEYFGGTTDPYFQRAVESFTAALSFAATAEQRDAANAGLAQAHLWLENWQAAYSAAALVSDDFELALDHDESESGLYNYIWEANSGTFRSYTTKFTFYEDYYRNTGDPRVRWGTDDAYPLAVGSLSGFGPVPYKPMLKYTSRNDDINIASAAEMRLIQAEAILRGAGSGSAMDLINQVRTANMADNTNANGYVSPGNTPLEALTAANDTEAWTHLKRERRIEMWLEGRAAPDERRWAATNAPGALDLPDWENPSNPGYTPLFTQYTRGPFCYDIPTGERDRNPNVPGLGG